jgi:excisionase family DNA binding protein
MRNSIQLPSPTIDPLLSVDELAAWLNVPKQTIYTWRKSGTAPPAYQLGRGLRFQQSDVERWLADRLTA